MGYLKGYLLSALADGHVYEFKTVLRIVYRQKNEFWVKNISLMLTKLFKKRPKSIKTKDGCWMIWIYVKKEKAKEFLKPWAFITKAERKTRKGFITGFFDADGQLYIRNRDYRVIFHQKERNRLQIMKMLLKEFGFRSHILGPYRNGKSFIYRLIIYGKSEVLRFLKCFRPLLKTTHWHVKGTAVRGLWSTGRPKGRAGQPRRRG